jgi:hypothetical protein
MDSAASLVGSGEIRPDVPSNNPSSKLRTFWFAILIIVGIGGLAVAGVGLGGFGVQQGWWQAGALSHLDQIHSIIMMAVGGGGGILSLIIGIIVSVKNKANVESRLEQLIIEIKSDEHLAALEFAHKILEDHPNVKATDFDWGSFAKQGLFTVDKSPSNPEISRLAYIFNEIWQPQFDEVLQQDIEDPWADEKRAKIADTCLKLSYALVCLTCDDMSAMQRKLPKSQAATFNFGYQSYHSRWVVRHSEIYQSIRNISYMKEDISYTKEHSERFYQEGTIQSQWRNLFNHHCDYVTQSGWGFGGNNKYYGWFTKDTPEEPLPKLHLYFDLPTWHKSE